MRFEPRLFDQSLDICTSALLISLSIPFLENFMSDTSTPTKTIVLDQLAEDIKKRIEGKEADKVIQFSKQIFNVLPSDELIKEDRSRLCAKVLSLWQKFRVRSDAYPQIDVFNPVLDEHGWQSNYTVIQILSCDMPFIVDSISVALTQHSYSIHSLCNGVIRTRRTEAGELIDIVDNDSGAPLESAVYIETDRLSNSTTIDELRNQLIQVLSDVTLVTGDHRDMLARANELKARISATVDTKTTDTKTQQDSLVSNAETAALLTWLEQDNFVFLAYKEVIPNTSATSVVVQDSSLGLWRSNQDDPNIDAGLYQSTNEPVFFGKDNCRASVHCFTHSDYLIFREFDSSGEIAKEHHFLGLFTSRVYRQSLQAIPVVRKKAQAVLHATGFERGGHNYKLVEHILDDLPREELLLASVEELLSTVTQAFEIGKRHTPHLLIRPAHKNGYYSCLYYVPRDLFNTALRARVQEILVCECSAFDVELSAQFSGSTLFRTHFMLYVNTHQKPVDTAILSAKVLEASRSWDEDLRVQFLESLGQQSGSLINNAFNGGFPPAYKEHFSPENAANDIRILQELTDTNRLALRFYQPIIADDSELRFKIYSLDNGVVLSDVIPILEKLGMRVLSEHPYAIQSHCGRSYSISDFKVCCAVADQGKLQSSKQLVQEAFSQIWSGVVESDRFNQLIVFTQIPWRDVALLRAYSRYMKQIRFGFSQSFIADTLARYPVITKQLVSLFQARFNPELQNTKTDGKPENTLEQAIIDDLESVDSLNDDRILRRFLNLIKATLRTNFFQRENKILKTYFSFKLDCQQIPDIPLPCPKFEVFVYSPEVEGVHLRSGSVARGGLRWSDRLEDYRTEVLGLVKAQQVKNSVIVPTGAKGCFIVKQQPAVQTREALQEEGIACYRLYIQGLLDLTDNLVAGQVVAPDNVVRHDGDDTYLVVAADKGTATFSDIANDLANDYGFWLGDAFASGGSEGYDHKKMGITAKGAWESVKRHFYERGVDVQTQEFTVLGIGDMGGDVFGNGMLLSEKIRLVAAFNHKHIFIDPTPNAETSYLERQRLFELPRSSWLDYDRDLISDGGGIFSRASKWVYISPEMKSTFGIEASRLTPNDFIKALLKSPVDLLWNGGIGTYVKSSGETHLEVGDKSNDNLRVNGCELQCKVLGEGGNLGATQLGRIEFTQHGGAANTDFIDNAGGVDCSDHEVNIKILLNELVQQGDLTLKQRNQLLRDMSDEVSDLVLKNNYRQALALNIAESSAVASVDDYIRLIKRLEGEGKLDRTLEFLPTTKALYKRKEEGKALTRPELSVLISYCKIELKQALTHSWLTSDPEFSEEISTAFPARLSQEFPDAIKQHRLRREIIATQIANDLVNRVGITFVDAIRNITGADYSQIAAAYLIVRKIYKIEARWSEIECLSSDIASDTKVDMMNNLIVLMRRATYWFLRHHRYNLGLSNFVKLYETNLEKVSSSVESLSAIIPQDRWQLKFNDYQQKNIPELLNAFCASAGSQYWLLDIIDIAEHQNQTINSVASVYFELGGELHLTWLDDQIRQAKAVNHWQVLASISYRNDLDHQLRQLTTSVLNTHKNNDASDITVKSLLSDWYESKRTLILRWRRTLQDIQDSKVNDSAAFSVALSVLLELV